MTGTKCGLFTHKSVPVIFEPPCRWQDEVREGGRIVGSSHSAHTNGMNEWLVVMNRTRRWQQIFFFLIIILASFGLRMWAG